jgi:hypothetical protein
MSVHPARAVRWLGVFFVASFATAISPRHAAACATCGCGDPTLTAVGVEKPYKNRLRLAVEERVGTRIFGTDELRTRVLMSRTQLGVAYTPHERITLAAFLPFFATQMRGTAEVAQINGVGDLELQARVVIARDRRFAPRHLFWLVAGVKTPTGPRLRDDAGYPYGDDDQPGTGSWDPLGGATYGWFGGFVSIYGSLLFRIPTTGPRGYRFGPTLLQSATVQLQPLTRLAIQLGVDLRYSWVDTLPNGAGASDTGGFVTALAPGLLINPWRDLLIRVAAEVPVAQALRGVQSLGPQGVLSLSYDIL